MTADFEPGVGCIDEPLCGFCGLCQEAVVMDAEIDYLKKGMPSAASDVANVSRCKNPAARRARGAATFNAIIRFRQET